MANNLFITILVTILVAGIAYFLVDETTLSHVVRVVANKTNVTANFAEQAEVINATQNDNNDTSSIFNATINSSGNMTLKSNASDDTSTVMIEDEFPPDPDAVLYSEIEHQNGLLTIPRLPDPKSHFMRNFALSYHNGTEFQHDSYSTNYSSCPITSQIIMNVQNWTFQTIFFFMIVIF